MKNLPKNKKEVKRRFGLYLPDKLLKKLENQAKKEDRSVNYFIVKRLENSFN